MNCVICLEEIKDIDCYVTFCNHVYHYYCLIQWNEYSRRCPLCNFERHITPSPPEPEFCVDEEQEILFKSLMYELEIFFEINDIYVDH